MERLIPFDIISNTHDIETNFSKNVLTKGTIINCGGEGTYRWVVNKHGG